MENSEILKQVNDVFIDILDNKNIVLKEDTTAGDIEEWDSLSHIQLVVAIEKHFKVHFTSSEILSWNSVGEMVSCIIRKRS